MQRSCKACKATHSILLACCCCTLLVWPQLVLLSPVCSQLQCARQLRVCIDGRAVKACVSACMLHLMKCQVRALRPTKCAAPRCSTTADPRASILLAAQGMVQSLAYRTCIQSTVYSHENTGCSGKVDSVIVPTSSAPPPALAEVTCAVVVAAVATTTSTLVWLSPWH